MATLTLGNHVRRNRERLGISRERLAQQANVSSATIARIELGDHIPNASVLWHLASALGVSMDELLAEQVA